MTGAALPTGEQALALATKRAVQAAGGLEHCRSETGLSTSHLSRCESRDHRDSITIRDAATIDAIGHGTAGHPFILKALARQLDHICVPLPSGPEDPDGISATAMELTAELGDVVGSVRLALSDGEVSKGEAEAALSELDQMDEKSAMLRRKLRAIVDTKKEGAAAGPAGPAQRR
jgi:hypothetical protein